MRPCRIAHCSISKWTNRIVLCLIASLGSTRKHPIHDPRQDLPPGPSSSILDTSVRIQPAGPQTQNRARDAPVVIAGARSSLPAWTCATRSASATLYDELAAALDIPFLGTEAGRSHVWRATLNTMLRAQGVPEEIRASYFGHEAEVNRRHYTDHRDASVLIGAAKLLRDTP